MPTPMPPTALKPQPSTQSSLQQGHNSLRLPTIVMLVTVAVFAVIGATHLGGLRWDFDEGVQAMEAYLWIQGFPLYEEIFSSDMPLFVGSIAGAFSLLEPSIQTARGITLIYSSIGLLAVGLLTSTLASRWAGPIAVVLLAVAPDYFLFSRVCIEDLPSFSLAALSILLLIAYYRSKKPLYLPVSGIVFGLALLLKLVPIVITPVPVAVIILSCHKRGLLPRKTLQQLLLFGFTAACPLLLCMVVFDPNRMLAQVAGYPAQATQAYVSTRAKNLVDILRYLALDNVGMTMLGIYAVWAAAKRRRWPLWPAIAWLILLILALAIHVPLWPHLLTGLLFPLAMLAGVGLLEVWRDLRLKQIGRQERRAAWLVVAVLTISLAAGLAEDTTLLTAPTPTATMHAISVIETETSPNSMVLTDEPLVPFLARRRVPGQLTDTSFKRIRSGALTAAQIIQLAEKHPAEAAFLGSDGRFRLLPDLISWIEAHYATEFEYEDGSRLFTDPL